MAAISQSKLKSFRRCQKQYSFRHDYADEGFELVRKVPKLALSRGSWLHSLQEAHHRGWAGLKTNANWEEVHERNISKFNAFFEEDREELGDLPGDTERLFRAYLRFWRDDQDRYTVGRLQGNGRPAVEFVFEVPLERWGIREPFKGRIDLLVADREYGGLWIWDHKWVKRIPDVDDRMMSPQALLYAWALRKLGYDIRGFLYNYARTKPPAIPQVLKRPAGMLSQRKNIDTDFYTYASAIRDAHGTKWKFYAKTAYRDILIRLKGRDKLWFRRERIPVEPDRVKRAVQEMIVSARDMRDRNKSHPPRSYFYNCQHFCDYHDICVTEFKGLDIAPLLRDRYEVVPERYSETEDLLIA
jgi:PD-(D/E)XK nuclease superfamily